MWELDSKESWVPKNWCFWTVVLEKILESPLDSKIKPVNPKENQFWIFTGRSDYEAVAPILWPPDAKNWLTGKDSGESLGLQGDQASQSERKSTLNIHWKDWCWSWSSNTLSTWCKEPTHWKTPWCWERLTARGEGDNRGWDGWVASLTQWTWVWANSRRRWRTGKPGMAQSMGSQRVGQDEQWAIEPNTPLQKAGPSRRCFATLEMFCKTEDPFYFTPSLLLTLYSAFWL